MAPAPHLVLYLFAYLVAISWPTATWAEPWQPVSVSVSFAKTNLVALSALDAPAHQHTKRHSGAQSLQLKTPTASYVLLVRPTTVLSNRLTTTWQDRFPDEPLPQIWTGHIAGDNTSVVRLAWIDSGVTGVIKAQNDWLSVRAIAKTHTASTPAALTDTLTSHQWQIKPIAPANANSANPLRQRLDNVAPRALRIGIVVDSRFNGRYRGRGLQQAIATIAGVDALFQANLGVALEVDGIRFYSDADDDPLFNMCGSPMPISEQYRPIRLADNELNGGLALVHLFTGHGNPAGRLGHGWIDTLCRNDGFDLSVSTPFSNDVVLVAHEMTHVFGAVHIDESTCAGNTTGNTLMQSRISTNTSATFSQCTIDRVRYVAEASCSVANIDVAINLNATVQQANDRRLITLSISNNDQLRGASAVVSHTTFPINTELFDISPECRTQGQRLICLYDTIAPASTTESTAWASIARPLEGDTTNQIISTRLLHTLFVDSESTNNRRAIDLARVDAGLDDISTPQNQGNSGTMATGALSLLSMPIGMLLIVLMRWSRRTTLQVAR